MFERSYPNAPLNLDYGTFFLQCMYGIQEKNPVGIKWNRLLDAVVTIRKYNDSTINHAIYIKFFTDDTVFYPTVSTDNVLNTTNN